jgi:hypothetical protein
MPGPHPRVLFFLEHDQDASLTKSGERRVVSKRLLFVEIDATARRGTSTTRPISIIER